MIDRARLYMVAPGTFPAESVRAVAGAGVDIVQLRMKDAADTAVVETGRAYRSACADGGAIFIVNDRPDLALAVDAGGVHLGQEDIPPAEARAVVGPRMLIGRSTHSVEDIERGRSEFDHGLCDYIAVGPVFHTPTHPTRAAVGLELVEYAAEHVDFPWFAIGGIDAATVGDVVGAGATRICVVRAIVDADDPPAAARKLRAALG